MFKHLIALTILIASASACAVPVGTQFSYQGRLEDNQVPATGLYDFEFRLFDALSGGTQIGLPLQLNDIPVEDGTFSVELDFGAGAFGGQARWLAVAVREGVSSGSYEALNPRQALTAAPVAQFALSGNPGPQGPSGVVQIVPVDGVTAQIPAGGSGAPWVFVQFATVAVSAGQRITGSAVASYTSIPDAAVQVAVALCISDNANGATLTAFDANDFPDFFYAAPANMIALSAAGSRLVSATGTYRVGMCVKFRNSSGQLTGDRVNSWFMITNS